VKLVTLSETNETDPLLESGDSNLEASTLSITNLTRIQQPLKKSETKDDLVKRLKSLGDQLEMSETDLSPRLLLDFKDAWQRLANKSSEFFDVRIPHSKQEEEDLRIYTARLLFLSKYFIIAVHLSLKYFHFQITG
jgi:hypothetical protein